MAQMGLGKSTGDSVDLGTDVSQTAQMQQLKFALPAR